MEELNYTSSFMLLMNVIILLIISCTAYDLVYVDKNVFEVFDNGEHYMGNCLYSTGNYTNTSDYRSNLVTVFSKLTSAAETSRTFSNTTSGSGPDKVNAWFYCKDSESDPTGFCSSCVRNSTRVLLNICPTRTGIVYSDTYCQVSYANSMVFPETDATSFAYCAQTLPRMPDPLALNRTVSESMEGLINRVVVGPINDSGVYAEEAVPGLYVDQNVDTVVRCLPGVTRLDCKECLLRALNETTAYCLSQGTPFGIDYRSSCWMGYNALVGAPLAPASSPTALPPTRNSSAGSLPTTSSSPGMLRWSVSIMWIIVVAIIL